LVCGSFQPFLEALRGHEVVGFSSTLTSGASAARPDTSSPTIGAPPLVRPTNGEISRA
jgi:hypothetical protein